MTTDDEQYDWYDDDDDDDERYDFEHACIECGSPGIDTCCCCGGWLCGMHGEIGAGFCCDCPTAEWAAEQDARMDEATRLREAIRAALGVIEAEEDRCSTTFAYGLILRAALASQDEPQTIVLDRQDAE